MKNNEFGNMTTLSEDELALISGGWRCGTVSNNPFNRDRDRGRDRDRDRGGERGRGRGRRDR